MPWRRTTFWMIESRSMALEKASRTLRSLKGCLGGIKAKVVGAEVAVARVIFLVELRVSRDQVDIGRGEAGSPCQFRHSDRRGTRLEYRVARRMIIFSTKGFRLPVYLVLGPITICLPLVHSVRIHGLEETDGLGGIVVVFAVLFKSGLAHRADVQRLRREVRGWIFSGEGNRVIVHLLHADVGPREPCLRPLRRS